MLEVVCVAGGTVLRFFFGGFNEPRRKESIELLSARRCVDKAAAVASELPGMDPANSSGVTRRCSGTSSKSLSLEEFLFIMWDVLGKEAMCVVVVSK